MTSKLCLPALLLVACWLVASSAPPAVAQDAPHTIVGVSKCNMCHKKAKYGNQAEIWQESKHAHAFATLATDEARAIASEKGLGDPQQEAECLKCHVSQAFLSAELHARTKYENDEGIGCEACHGPGSDYKSAKIMKDPEAATAAGLILPDADSCTACHNETSPTYLPFDYEERWAQIVHPVPTAE